MKLPTYRNEKDKSGLPIQKVGIRKVRAPIVLLRKKGNDIMSIGEWSIYCDLSEKFKGASMSLMQRILFNSLEKYTSTGTLIDITQELIKESEHKAKSAYAKVKFPYVIDVQSPKSELLAPKIYDCELEVTNIDGKIRKFLTVTVQFLCVCPCSLELAKHLMETEGKESGGHQQRGFAKVTIEFDEVIWIEDLIVAIESAVKSLPYPIVRKPDEQYICYVSRQNPLFVEESSRAIALVLNENPKILDFVVVCNHEESIHQSNAVAVIRKGKGMM